MTDIEQAKASQLRNIEAKVGRSLATLCEELRASGKTRHGEARTWAMTAFGLGYGDANALVHAAHEAGGGEQPDGDPLDQIYAGKKQPLREIHDRLIAAITPLGTFEMAPKKAYVAFRRKKQFAMLGPKNASVAELGINLKESVASDRIVVQKAGGMCQYAVTLATADAVDDELLAVLRRAFDAAG